MAYPRYDIDCPRCKEQVASVFSSEPLPGIYHPECAEAEQFEDDAEEGEES